MERKLIKHSQRSVRVQCHYYGLESPGHNTGVLFLNR